MRFFIVNCFEESFEFILVIWLWSTFEDIKYGFVEQIYVYIYIYIYRWKDSIVLCGIDGLLGERDCHSHPLPVCTQHSTNLYIIQTEPSIYIYLPQSPSTSNQYSISSYIISTAVHFISSKLDHSQMSNINSKGYSKQFSTKRSS